MTREEAIDRLRKISEKTPIRTNGNDLVAITMAIQALSQEPTVKPMTVDEMEREYEKSKALFHKIVESDDAISREDAREAFSKWFFDRKDLRTVDEVVDKLPPVTQKSETVTEFADRCRECGAKYGKLLEQKSGKWIMSDDGLYRPICDNCGAHPWKGYIPTVEEATEVFKYCPNCGAKMESEVNNG